MDNVDVHLKALLWYSGNAQLASTRQHLIRGLNDDELLEVVKRAMSKEFARGAMEEIAMTILDVTARDPATANGDGSSVSHATASVKNEQVHGDDIQQQSGNEIMVMSDQPASGGPATDGHGGDDGGEDDAGGGRNNGRASSNHAAKQSGGSRSAQATQQPSAQTPTSRANRSSTANGKRKGSNLSQAAKKRRKASPEPMDDEEDLVKEGIHDDGEQAKNSETTINDSAEADSQSSETDSDNDTSLDRDTPWKRTQKLSIMPDLYVEDSDNEDDEDYTEGLHFDPYNLGPLHPNKVKILSVKVYLRVPAPYRSHQNRELKDFPITFVKQLIRKFNEDFLKGAANRKAYREMIYGEKTMRMCVHRRLRSLQNKSVPPLRQDGFDACDSCKHAGTLCAYYKQLWNEEPSLVILPPSVGNSDGIDYQSFDSWVSKQSG